MSWRDASDPVCVEEAAGAVELVLQSKPRDLGGFEVRRVLPSSPLHFSRLPARLSHCTAGSDRRAFRPKR